MVLVDPIDVILQNQTKVFGSPVSIKKIQENLESYDLDKEIGIPSSQLSV